MRTLVCEGFGGFYSSVELTFVSWQKGSFLVGKILVNAHILRDPFLIQTLLIRVNVGHKVFPYILICGAQRKSHAGSVKSSFTPVSFLPLVSYHV